MNSLLPHFLDFCCKLEIIFNAFIKISKFNNPPFAHDCTVMIRAYNKCTHPMHLYSIPTSYNFQINYIITFIWIFTNTENSENEFNNLRNHKAASFPKVKNSFIIIYLTPMMNDIITNTCFDKN